MKTEVQRTLRISLIVKIDNRRKHNSHSENAANSRVFVYLYRFLAGERLRI